MWYVVQHIKLSLNANASTKHKRQCKLVATQGAAKQLLFSLHLSARNFIATTFFHLQPFFATSPVQKVVALDENIIIPSCFCKQNWSKCSFKRPTHTTGKCMSKFNFVNNALKQNLKTQIWQSNVVGRIGGGGRVGGRENNWPTDWDKIRAWRLTECSRLPTRDVRVCGICHSFPRKFKAVVYCCALQRWSNRYVFFSVNPI